MAVAAIGLGGQAVVFLLHIIMTRSLGAHEYGLVMIQLAYANSLLIAATAGQERAALRLVPLLRADPDAGLLRAYLRFTLVLIGVCSLVVAASYFLAAPYLPGLGSGNQPLAALAAVYLAGSALLARNTGLLRGLGQPVVPQLAESLVRPALIITVLGALAFMVEPGLSAIHALMAFAAAPWILQLVLHFRLGTVAGSVAAARSATRLQAKRAREWVRLGISLALAAAALALMYSVDIIMLGALVDPEAAALYGVASRLSLLLLFGTNAVQIVVSPLLSGAHAQGDRPQVLRLVHTAALFGFVIAAGIGTLFLLFGTLITGLFGAEFVAAVPALHILVLGQLLNAFTGITGAYISMTCNPRTLLLFIGFGLVVNVILNAVLIPAYGIRGAAIASVVSHGAWNIAALFYVLRHHQIDLSIVSATAAFARRLGTRVGGS